MPQKNTDELTTTGSMLEALGIYLATVSKPMVAYVVAVYAVLTDLVAHTAEQNMCKI